MPPDSSEDVALLQLSISEKGFKKMVELFKHYRDTLHDPSVFAYFQARARHPSMMGRFPP